MVLLAIFVMVHSVARVPLASAVSAVKSTWLLPTHVTTTHVKTVVPVKSLQRTSSDAFARLDSTVSDVNNVFVNLIHACTVVSVWSLATPSNANAHHNTPADAVNC